MACEVPVVATDTPPTRWMLGDAARFLSPLGDVDALSARLEANLELDRISYPGRQSWTSIAARYAALLATPGQGAWRG
jgi:glycosyltransferase involved in cell wall biosynthesis